MTHKLKYLFREITHSPAPRIFPAPGWDRDGVESFFYESVPWRGRPSRVFALRGFPEGADADNPVPGIVLVHGGGGSAFDDWARLWKGRGYAAIAMDLNGHVPSGKYSEWDFHEHAGPTGNAGKFPETEKLSPFSNAPGAAETQWPYHALAAILLAVNIMQDDPRVQKNKIGITGVSWGGWLTCLAAAADVRFKAAAPVYGCGFIHRDSCWKRDGEFDRMGAEAAARWIGLWEPSTHLADARCPFLWVNGTNDFAYWPESWFGSARLVQAGSSLCMTLRMPHGHGGPGENPPEILAFMDHSLRGGQPLASIVSQKLEGRTISAKFTGAEGCPVVRAELLYTTSDNPDWPSRRWEVIPAQLDTHYNLASADFPEGARCGFINLLDTRGLTVSSDLAMLA